MTVFPRSVGTFLMSRSEISLKEAAVSRIVRISSAGTPSSPSRCRWVNAILRPLDDDLVHAVRLGEPDVHLLGTSRGEVLAHVVGPDRKLAVPAIDEHRQLDPLWPAEIDQRVHGGPDRASREEHVVDQEDAAAVDG